MDPPYRKGLEKAALAYLAGSSLADEETLVIIEADIDTDFSWTSECGFEVIREKKYKTNKHMFLKRKQEN